MYYYLVNVEEHPEALPAAYDFVAGRLEAPSGNARELGAWPASFSEASFNKVLNYLAELGSRFTRPWTKAAEETQATEELTRRRVLFYFSQYLPTALLDGCWLQGGLEVPMAHTQAGSSLTALYQHQVCAFVANPRRHFVGDYRATCARLTLPEEVSSYSFVDRVDLRDSSLPLPIFLLGISQFPQNFCAEILGLNLAWQFLGLSAFGPDLLRDTRSAYGLPPPGDDLVHSDHFEKGRGMACEAALRFLKDGDKSIPWERLLRGVHSGVGAWTEWFDRTVEAAPTGPPDPRQEMIDMLWRKAPHACGYHAGRRLGGKRIDEHLAPKTFDGPALLEDLARSPWVNPGDPDRSALLKRLIGFGGPMLSVFSPAEVQIIENWIGSLPPKRDLAPEAGATSASDSAVTPHPAREEEYVVSGVWAPTEFRRRSEGKYRKCTVRELYHHLINLEFDSDVLPLAERFARDRLQRSMAMLWKGDRPIPSRRYDPAALERWVYTKHREQVESYRSPDKRPEVAKDEFIETTVQLAPLVLIDGGWLQGMASPALIHTTVGRMLFHVLAEELGEGKWKEHHANIYRNLLAAMGVNAPPVDTWDFARWSRLNDSSFDVPTLWLSISCFPRHFLPEILGLNLAVELAGVGGPYMEARDTLRRFGYPTLFVDVHNAADNVSAGHVAWAMKAISRYMDDMAEREGPHNLDHTWHRVWAGVRATLPQIGRVRLMAHQVAKRLFSRDPTLIPRIFPS
jgi:hypothetical protein